MAQLVYFFVFLANAKGLAMRIVRSTLLGLTGLTFGLTLNIANSSSWDNIYEPPQLNNPRTFLSVEDLPVTESPAFGVVCAGKIYRINSGDEDVLVDLAGDEPLKYPLLIQSTKNVIVRAVTFDLAIQEGCGVNELPNNPTNLHPNSNVMARPPTGRVLGLTVKGVAWIEGVYIDANWQNTDCIVWSAPGSEIESYGQSSSFYLINSRCDHYDGHGKSDIGDSLHADLFQNQVGAPAELYFENVVAVTGNEGIINLNKTGSSRRLEIRNFAYIEDTENQVGPVNFGPMLSTNVPDSGLKFENVWHNAPGPSVWGPHNGSWPANWRFDPHNATHAGIPGHEGISKGQPPVDFAPVERIGNNYKQTPPDLESPSKVGLPEIILIPADDIGD